MAGDETPRRVKEMEWRVNILRSRRFGSHRKHGVDMECFIFGRVQGIQASPAQAGNLSASFCGEYPAGWDLDAEVDNNSAKMEKILKAMVYAPRGSHP